MELDKNLIKEFASVMKPPANKNKDTKLYGTISKFEGDTPYVILDGSDLETPAEASVATKIGDRVVVQIRNHKAYISDNFTAPPDGRMGDKYFYFDPERGLIIGRIDPDTHVATGTYILVTDEEYQIWAKANTDGEEDSLLAVYGRREVHLGYDSDRAIISLCDDSGRIYYTDGALVLNGDNATGIRSRADNVGSAQVAVAANSTQLASNIEVRNSSGTLLAGIYCSGDGISLLGSAIEAGNANGSNAGRIVTANAVMVEGSVTIAGKIKHGEGRRYEATIRNIPSGYRLTGIRWVDTTHNQMLRITAFGVNPSNSTVFVKVFNASATHDWPGTGQDRAAITIYWFAIRSSSVTTIDTDPIVLPDDYTP